MSAAQIREEITAKIVAALEGGQTPFWRKPWLTSVNAGAAANFVSKKHYRGINVLLLAPHALKYNHHSRWYGTFEQWKALGGMVQKRPADVEPGCWGCRVVFFKPLVKTVTNEETGEERQETFPLLKTYTLFCADQVDGDIVDRYRVIEPKEVKSFPDFKPADELIQATGAEIQLGGEKAYYDLKDDYIQVPNHQRFSQPGAWYETVLHELAHWSEVRVGWDRKGEGYAMGELVAELAACFVSGELHIPQGEDLGNHAAYLQNWLKGMKADAGFIFKATSQASKVSDYLLSHVRKEATAVA